MKKTNKTSLFSVGFFNNPENRAVIYQIISLLLIAILAYYFMNNMFLNIEKRGITTGFGFLSNEAGFGITQALIDYDDTTSTYSRVFYIGILNTLLVSVIGIIFATILGLTVGIGRLSSNWLVSKLCTVYVELFRNIPILLQILFWYNVVLAALPSPRQSISFSDSIFLNNRGLNFPKPIFESGFIGIVISIVLAFFAIYLLKNWSKKRHDETGKEFSLIRVSFLILFAFPIVAYYLSGMPISLEHTALKGFNFKGGLTIIPELLALAFALSIYTATYIAEAVRAGIESVPKGQKEAARSLGLKEYIILQKVVLPQALRVIIPPVINQYLNLVKNSSLATAIGYPELVTLFSGTTLNQVGQAIEIILMTMMVYLFISIVISILMNTLNKKMQIKER